MKAFFETIAVGFGLFSAMPAPRFEWNEKNMRYLLLVFPLVGVIIGAVCVGWDALCGWLGFPAILRGAGFTLIPILLSGGFHMDGYVDTCDALASQGDREKKAQILRDPHIGAFAVIRAGMYFVLMLGVWSALPGMAVRSPMTGDTAWDSMMLHIGVVSGTAAFILQMIMLFTLSRILSGIAVVSFPRTPEEDLLHVFYDYADKRAVRTVLIIFDVIASAVFCLTGAIGVCMALTAHLVFLFYHRQCIREFGGVSGDQAGWFLVQAEKWLAIVMVVMAYIFMPEL